MFWKLEYFSSIKAVLSSRKHVLCLFEKLYKKNQGAERVEIQVAGRKYEYCLFTYLQNFDISINGKTKKWFFLDYEKYKNNDLLHRTYKYQCCGSVISQRSSETRNGVVKKYSPSVFVTIQYLSSLCSLSHCNNVTRSTNSI